MASKTTQEIHKQKNVFQDEVRFDKDVHMQGTLQQEGNTEVGGNAEVDGTLTLNTLGDLKTKDESFLAEQSEENGTLIDEVGLKDLGLTLSAQHNASDNSKIDVYTVKLNDMQLANVDTRYSSGYTYPKLAIGYRADAGEYATAIGYRASATPDQTVALGYLTTARVIGCTAIGFGADAAGSYAIAIGHNPKASASYSIAIGTRATGVNSYGIAIGYQATATDDCVSLGRAASTWKSSSVAIGAYAHCNIQNSVSFDGSYGVGVNRTIILFDPTHIFFRNENVNDKYTVTSQYANGKSLQDYLDTKQDKLPDLPSDDGTYVLKAVKSGDTITYSWVLEA